MADMQICLILLDRGFLLLTGNSFNGNVKLMLLLFLLTTRTACETVMMFVTRGVLIVGCGTMYRNHVLLLMNVCSTNKQ